MTHKPDEFVNDSAMNVMNGVSDSHDGTKKSKRKRFVKKNRDISVDDLFAKIKSGSRLDLAKGITLLESIANHDRSAAQELLLKALPHTGKSIRIGITGVPGAGKSTFIESFGLLLSTLGFKIAVLAIDPSSSLTGGSILGDKTRMEKLASDPNTFIRPSPTSGTLGGVHRKTRETMLLCEAAGYDIILVETVGVGQSETAVRNMVDFFMLLALTGAGDDLQGMKKGIMELTDLIVVNKADGDNERLAKRTMREYRQILHVLQPVSPGWTSNAVSVSSLNRTGFEEIWETILDFKEQMLKNEYWETRRAEQTSDWFRSMINDQLIENFFNKPGKKEEVSRLESKLLDGKLTVASAVDKLFE
ncbi:MAG TPA: methylmalonyl Co-A mutase-associated GTPase MeaB [Pseudogracilibacillus sp.]|nr:methylmalonyl Co-A mutase-associated GTPase MeaB [Pseudogracilibacillus sp.]